MKITDPEGLQQNYPEKIRQDKDRIGSNSFNNILKETLWEKDPNDTIQKASHLSEPLSIQPFNEMTLGTDYVDRTSRLIDLMDAYTKSLSNPQKTLKDIEPELLTFIEEAQNLHEAYANSGSPNAELKAIMEALLRTARLEGARFQRGDYLDSE
jgi:hypothetical protein